MQIKPIQKYFPVLFSYLAFLLSWGIGQVLDLYLRESGVIIQLTFFMVVYIALTGIALPLVLARRFGFPLHESVSRWRILGGLGVFGLVLIISVFLSDALPLLAANPPSLEVVVKYLFLFGPMALGICLQCFFLIPYTLEAVLPDRRWTPLASIGGSMLAVGLAFWVDK